MVAIFGFVVLAFMFTGYVLLDGYDLGIGTISRFVSRNEQERGALLQAIGPFWNGNEVWLIAAGGALFAFFPQAYAVSFSGFYLPFIIVLWLLMFRGVAIELRETIDSPLWRALWDTTFALASGLLVVFYGVALGNLLRGVDIQHGGFFFGSFTVLLNPYSVGVGLFALAALALHGALYATMRIEGDLAARCTTFAKYTWWVVLLLFLILTVAAVFVFGGTDVHQHLGGIVALGALIALIVVRRRIEQPRVALAASSAFLALLMVDASVTLFPYLIPNLPRGSGGLTIYDAGPGNDVALAAIIALVVIALVALLVYRALLARQVTRPIQAGDEGGYG